MWWLLFLFLSTLAVHAQSNPGFIAGAQLCADTGCSSNPPINPLGLNQAFMGKADYPLDTSGIFSTPHTWTAPQNFVAGEGATALSANNISIQSNGPTSGFEGGYVITGTPTPLAAVGTQLETYNVANEVFSIQSQINTPDGGGFLNGRNAYCLMNSPLIIGGVQCLTATVDLMQNTSPMQNNFNYVGVFGQAVVRGGVNETAGVFASGFFAYAYSGATFQGLEGGEVDCAAETNVHVVNILCWSIVALGNKKSYGSMTDYAVAVGGQNGTFGFKGAFMLTGANGAWPLASDGSGVVMGTDIGGEVRYGVDFTNLTCTIACFASPGFSVSQNGSGSFLNLTSNTLAVSTALTDQQQVMDLAATQPINPTAQQNAVVWLFNSNGNAPFLNQGFSLSYQNGYTGTATTRAAQFLNSSQGTAHVLPGGGVNAGQGNVGIRATSNGTAPTAYNAGIVGDATGGAMNSGVLGVSLVANPSAINVGVMGTATNTGAGGLGIAGYFTAGRNTPPTVNAVLLVDGEALADQQHVMYLSATQPAAPTASQQAVLWQITSAGTASQNTFGFELDYLAGYTGNQSTFGAFILNSTMAPVGGFPASGVNVPLGNIGLRGAANGMVAGWNFGLVGTGSQGNTNVGVMGVANVQPLVSNGLNIGVAGSAVDTGVAVMIGGWFSLAQTTPPAVSAALIADNAGRTLPIFVGMVNNVPEFELDQNGIILNPAMPLIGSLTKKGQVCIATTGQLYYGSPTC